MLENYLVRQTLGHLLSYKSVANVPPSHKRLIVHAVVDFMVTTFGGIKEVSSKRRQMTALATIALFPCFIYKDSKSDGTVNSLS